jgi:maleate isomerase
MHGWRGRLGLVLPSSNTTNEPEFARHLPDGVSLHTSRMHLEDANPENLTRMADDLERCADLLGTADVDVVAYGCTTGSLVKGAGYDEEIEGRIEARVGVPAVATAASIKRAFDALGAERLALTTPYVDDLTEREVTFLEAAGYDVLDVSGLGIESGRQIGEEPPERVYRRARALDTAGADAVFVSCTNYRTFEVIERLEADLGVPVVTSNQATLWDALRTMGVTTADPSLGTLFEN